MKHITRAFSLFICFCLLISLLFGLFSCSDRTSAPVTENRMSSVITDGESIRIEIDLTDGALESCKDGNIYLFELPSVYSSDADLSELDPISEAKPRKRTTFILSLYEEGGSRLHSSYLAATYDEETKVYTPLTPPAALSNPEALAPVGGSAPRGGSIKGLIADHPADAIRLGASHTVVEVPMERLILSGWQEGAISYVYGGLTRYLDADALALLDDAVEVYTAAGVEVYLRFTLGDPEGHDVPLGLYLPGAVASEATDYAVNMTTPFSTAIVEGFFDFIADRYATPAEGGKAVSAFILGSRVNNGATYNNAAGMDLAAYVTNYEKLTRVAYAALVSHNADGRVYMSTDSRRVVTDGQGWDIPAFLSAFAEEVALRGDYGWHVACELYSDSPALWEDAPDIDTNFFTVRNLGVLTGILNSADLRREDQPRRLLITGFSIPAVVAGGEASEDADNRQAASYAYAYLTCVQNGGVEALIYDVHTDPSPVAVGTDLRGLWRVELDGSLSEDGLDVAIRPASPRPIYGVFRMMDTTDASTLSEALTGLIGSSYTKLESALAGKAAAVTLLKWNGKLLPYDGDHGKATPLFTFNSGSLHGFTDGGGLTYLELVHAEPLGINTLHARFDRNNVSEPMGVTVTIPATDLIGGKELLLDLYGGQTETSVSSVRPTVTLRLTRPSRGEAADGAEEIRYEASVSDIKSASWQTVSFEISDFAARLDTTDEVTLTLFLDYPPATAPNGPTAHHLGLAGVYVVGSTTAAGTSKGFVIAVIVLLSILVIGATALLAFGKKRRKEE